jgi:hypothetical protein
LKSNGSTLSGGEKQLANAAELLLHGTTHWDGTSIKAGGSSKISNESLFLATADGVLSNLGGAVFTNNGTFKKSGGAGGTTKIETRFENNGTLQVDSGKVHLTGGGKSANGASILIGSAALLEIDSDLELTANSVLEGQGQAKLLSGKLTAQGTIGLKNFSFDGGSLAGSNTFTGTVDWNGGHWNSDIAGVSTIIGSTGLLHLRGANSDFNNRSIFNDGVVNWHAGNLSGGNGSVFTNQNLFYDLASGNKSIASQGGSFTFTNNGTYLKSANGTTTIGADFVNNGTLHIAAGQVVFASGFTNNGAVKVTNGANAQFSTPLNFGVNAPLQGTGTINAPSVTAAGVVAPGVSPGTLTLTGNLTLLNTSTLLIEIGGRSQGLNYDFLNVGGIGTLGGNLEVSFLNGFQSSVTATDQFTIFTATGTLLNSFDNVASGQRLPIFGGFGSFQVNYGVTSLFGPGSVVLSHFSTVVPEPSTYVMIGLGAVFVLFTLRRRK